MNSTRSMKRHSLRLWLPLLVSLLALCGGGLVFVSGERIHRAEFEQEFTGIEMLRATRLRADVERWVQRDDLEMVQTIFGELTLLPEIRLAVYLNSDDLVLASTRRDLLGRSLDLNRLSGIAATDQPVSTLLEKARGTLRNTSLWWSKDRNVLFACLPTALPLEEGRLEVQRRGLVLLVYDLKLEKAVRLGRMKRDFFIYLANILVMAVTLAVALHFLITRRLERLESAMEAFAAGKPHTLQPDRLADEISHLKKRFGEMATLSRQAMAEVEDLYNRAPCGYHSLDASGTFVRINDTELSWLGYSREEVVGRLKFSDVLLASHLEHFRSLFGPFKATGALRDAEFEMIRKDGSTFPVVLSATAIKDESGNFLKSRSIVYDVTELKRAQAEINLLNADLERRVELRTQQLEEANRELASFSYSMSHDLRTPLRSIDGFSHALLHDYAAKLDRDGLEHLERVRRATQKMAQMLDDMVRLIQISRVEMSWTNVNLTQIATRIINDHLRCEPGRAVEFAAQPHCLARGDPTLLGLLLENALDNAWKFSAGRGVAKIEFGRTGTAPHTVFFVRDNGCGLDMRYGEKLFNAFQRLHDGTDFPGTGIGLACVRRVVQRHGGRAWIDGVVNAGTTLYFTLPAPSAEPPAVNPSTAPA